MVGWRRRRDSNPRDGFPPAPLAGVCLRPLGHVSADPFTEAAGGGQGGIGGIGSWCDAGRKCPEERALADHVKHRLSRFGERDPRRHPGLPRRDHASVLEGESVAGVGIVEPVSFGAAQDRAAVTALSPDPTIPPCQALRNEGIVFRPRLL